MASIKQRTDEDYPVEVEQAFSVRKDLRDIWNAIERLRKQDAEAEVRLDSHADQIADLQRLIGE